MPSISGQKIRRLSLTDYRGLTSTMSNQQQQALPMVDPEYLQEAMRQDGHTILILDCRSVSDYVVSHIGGALNVTLPSLMLRRLVAGKLSLSQILKHLAPETADAVEALYTSVPIVLYDHLTEDLSSTSLMTALCKKLIQEGCSAHCLRGSFESFQQLFPEWCESSVHNEHPIMGLTSLRISPLNSEIRGSGGIRGPPGGCDSSLGRETPLDDLCFPVEILPHLYLGNAKNSGDREALNRHKIRYIVNVTPNLPNVFEESGTYKYMQIPIADHWSQNLASFFPKAIQFIDEARENGVGVLVHCLAGISRSVTITVAYLMYKEKLSLEDAYEYVRVKKANIAPNFNFMGQLQDFQQQLNLTPNKCQCVSLADCRCRLLHFISPTSSRASPDSGIEFDRFS